MEFVAKQPDEGINVSPTHPLKELVVLLLGIALVVTVLFLLVVLLIELTVPLIPPAVEARVFSGWGELASEAFGVSAARDEELQGMLDRIALRWPDNPYQSPYALSAWLLDSPEINAMALPGGTVMVTRGLLDAVENEQELAFVLGHELGHFANRDHLRRLGRGTILMLLLATLSGGGAPESAVELVSHLELAASTGFDRQQELDADRFGVDLVEAEYGESSGAIAFFERLEKISQEEGSVAWLPYLRTHPTESDRVAHLKQAQRSP